MVTPYTTGQKHALFQLKLADLRELKRVLLGAGLLGGGGYLAHRLWNAPLEQNKAVARQDYVPADDRVY